MLLSVSERDFITRAVDSDCRADGRSRLDYRRIDYEVGTVLSAFGSCKARFASDPSTSAEVVVSCKLEISQPQSDSPNSGNLYCQVECSSSATADFEGRGGDDLASNLSQSIERVYGQKSAFDGTQLCVIPGKVCWDLYIDVTVLRNGGNLMDLICFAIRMALEDCKTPRLTIEELVSQETDASMAAADFDIEDTEQDMQPLNIEQVPILITFIQIGERLIVDSSLEEEACANCQLSIAVNKNGEVVAMQKSGNGSLRPSLLQHAIHNGRRLAVQFLLE